MSAIKNAVDLTINNYTTEKGIEAAAVDPATVFLIMDIIMQVIDMIKNCRQNPADGAAMMNRPTLLQKLVLRRNVKKSLDREDRHYGEDFTKAIIKTGSTLNAREVEELYNEV